MVKIRSTGEPTQSRSERVLEHRENLPPPISPGMARSVSHVRREMLEQELEQGLFRESSNYSPSFGQRPSKKNQESSGLTSAGMVRGSGDGLFRKAQSLSTAPVSAGGAGGAAGVGFRGSGGTVRQTPEVYSPLWLNSNLNLPRDRATINAWSRSFFALNPIVHNAITLHSTYPIAKLNIKCKIPKIEKFFAAMIEELDLISVCSQIAQEFWVLGEAFVYAELDDRTAKWSRLLIQNPDYITVKRSAIAGEPIISLRPDENLRRVIFSNNPSDMQQRQQLDPAIIEHVKRGENIPLNNFYVSHLSRKISPYEIRGTGIIVPTFRQLMLLDKFRESKFAQADGMVNPLTLVKVGSEEFRPTPTDLAAWRDVFAEAQYDKDFKIFTHNAVTVERVGWAQGIYDISGDVTQLIKEIYIGLMVPSVIMDGADTTYATGSVSLDVLRQRYMQFRGMLSAWLKRKIFAPISKLNDFYEWKEGEKVLIVPDVDWNHMSLFDMSDYISNLSNLRQGDVKQISLQTLYKSLGVNYDDEQRKIRYENVQDAIHQREIASLAKYSLNDLRALGPNAEIEELADAPVPGETPPGGEGSSEGGLPGAPGGGLNLSMPPAPSGSAPQRPVGRPKGPQPPQSGGGTGIGAGGIPRPPSPT